jgi:signal transduction histidine kinase
MSVLHQIDIGLALAAVLINGAFILLTLTRTSLTAVYVTFLFNCVAAMIWNLGDFMVFKTGNTLWFYFSLLGTGMIPAVFFHFINALIEPGKNRSWCKLAYAICIPLTLSSPLALLHPGIRDFVDGPIWNVVYFIVLLPFFGAGAVIVKRAIKRSKSASEVSRIRYVLLAAVIAIVSGATDLLQIFHAPVPPLGHLGTVIYSSILAIGVYKHRAAYDLLAEMRTKLDMVNELAAGIAHEIGNPLSSIKGAASLLRSESGSPTDEKADEYLALIGEEVERLDGILTNYRSLIRPPKIFKEPANINTIIEKTVRLMQMNAAGPEIRLNLAPKLTCCDVDPQSLKQVFINLIKNAYEACGPECKVDIRTEYISPWIRITISDTGKGLPPEILPHAFEPFVSTKENSLGLGLAICRRLIDLNGGTIEAANNETEGARFTIHLPPATKEIPMV